MDRPLLQINFVPPATGYLKTGRGLGPRVRWRVLENSDHDKSPKEKLAIRN